MTAARTHRTSPLIAPPAGMLGVPAPAGGLFRLLTLWLHRARSRRALARLDAHGLKDIGVTPEAARAEAAKPFWRS